MTQIYLKNCPHCKSQNLKPVQNKTSKPGIYKCYIKCIDCNARGSLKESLEKAVEMWNGEGKEIKKRNNQATLFEVINLYNN